MAIGIGAVTGVGTHAASAKSPGSRESVPRSGNEARCRKHVRVRPNLTAPGGTGAPKAGVSDESVSGRDDPCGDVHLSRVAPAEA